MSPRAAAASKALLCLNLENHFGFRGKGRLTELQQKLIRIRADWGSFSHDVATVQ